LGRAGRLKAQVERRIGGTGQKHEFARIVEC
jgi:hypothetical protein